MMIDASLTACHHKCQTLMAVAIYSLESIYSVEFGLSLRPLLVVYMMIDASLTAYHDMPDPMAVAIYSLVSIYSVEFGLSLRPSSRWST